MYQIGFNADARGLGSYLFAKFTMVPLLPDSASPISLQVYSPALLPTFSRGSWICATATAEQYNQRQVRHQDGLFNTFRLHRLTVSPLVIQLRRHCNRTVYYARQLPSAYHRLRPTGHPGYSAQIWRQVLGGAPSKSRRGSAFDISWRRSCTLITSVAKNCPSRRARKWGKAHFHSFAAVD